MCERLDFFFIFIFASMLKKKKITGGVDGVSAAKAFFLSNSRSSRVGVFYDAALCSCKAAPAHSFALLGAGKVAGVWVKYYITKINVV